MEAESKKTKLTLSIGRDIIEKAKAKAKARGISVSRLFEESIIEDAEKKEMDKRNKALKELRELIEKSEPVQALPESDRELYHRHLDEKYG